MPSSLVHDDLYCEDPACSPNGQPEHWVDAEAEARWSAIEGADD